MKGCIYAVYNEKNRVIGLYANETWAKRKADRSDSYRVETYVHTENRKMIEMA
ncbi:hypothetical protein JOC34_000549 [Virgibacillus halotolerans]|uniref:hypothetical protein n=1 Tax=Virgibacillus halotolerans TaxID=1071053 RepID=UPI001960A927|nr:hypothetical protein [Virgibacillus halotolerans]MBM7598192.1 hypothetical protein [Virgibacillus halotolerans]